MEDDLPHSRIERIAPLSTPAELRRELSVTPQARAQIARARREIEAVLDGRDPRLLCIVGPCSIHDPAAALDYAQRLAQLRDQHRDSLLICMRAFFEKPRTTLGWKGLLNDPRLDGSCDLGAGLRTARTLLCQLAELGLPAASETLDPAAARYVEDLLAWTAIGARTTESQTHRELASGLGMPVGFKNSTGGGLEVAIHAMQAARAPHSFIGIDEHGRAGAVRTLGHAHTHLVLRGGRGGPNYREPEIERACAALSAAGLVSRVLVDCSHDNSDKDANKQPAVVAELARQLEAGSTRILGVMLESHLVAGRQELKPGCTLRYGQSITDACIDIGTTAEVLAQLSAAQRSALRKRAELRAANPPAAPALHQ